MDMVGALGLGHELDATSPSGLACHDPAEAETSSVAASISWVSARSEYWPARCQPGTPSGLNFPEPLLGVLCLVLAVGVSGAEWVDCLARSRWFAGLEPQPEDLAGENSEPAGRWCLPDHCGESHHDSADAALAYFEHGPVPHAPLTTVAIMPDASQADLAATLGLVAALRERRHERGCRTAVVVTVEGSSSPALRRMMRRLRALGAFVVRPGIAAGGDHLHHFPLRAATIPRVGRLVCTDLADHLACWAPGGVADLHVIPSANDAAEEVFRRLADVGHADGQGSVQVINLHLHLDADAPGSPLVKIDRLANACHALLRVPYENMVVTDTERLDGTTATADLLIVR